MTVRKLVYLIEDDVDILNTMAALLLKNGFEVNADWNGNHFEKAVFPAVEPDIYIIDINLDGKSGLDISRIIKEKTPFIPVMLMSANHNITAKMLDAGADAFLEKPFDIKNLLRQINQLTMVIPTEGDILNR